jgi:hypothetical protein
MRPVLHLAHISQMTLGFRHDMCAKSLDPDLRAVVGARAKDNQAASTSERVRLETQTISTQQNLKFLMDLPGRWIDQAHQHRKLAKLILDMDSCSRRL